MSKVESSSGGGCVALAAIVAFVAVWAATKFWLGLATFVLIIVTAAVVSVSAEQKRKTEQAAARAARLQALTERFGERVARDIDGERYWQGATLEMMYESLGAPADVREKVYKTKTKTTHYYKQISAQRYALKLHFENGIVVGWDD